jgi:hypothetical protein
MKFKIKSKDKIHKFKAVKVEIIRVKMFYYQLKINKI